MTSPSMIRQKGQAMASRSGLRRCDLVHAHLVDALAGLVLHPHAAAPAAAAEAALPGAGQLGQAQAGHGRRGPAGARRRPGCSGPGSTSRGRWRSAAAPMPLAGGAWPGGEQLLDELAVVEHLPLAAELGVLVLEGVEAVGAGGDDAPELVLLQRLDVLLCLLLVEVLLAGAARPLGVAGSPLRPGWRSRRRRRA